MPKTQSRGNRTEYPKLGPERARYTNDHWLEPMPITAGDSSPACGGGRVGGRFRASGSGGRSPITLSNRIDG